MTESEQSDELLSSDLEIEHNAPEEEEKTLGEIISTAKEEEVFAIQRGVKAKEWKSGRGRQEEETKKELKKRGKKSRPREISSRKPVAVGRERCLGLDDSTKHRSVKRFDPRFEEHCGDLREEHVERNYAFVQGLREKRRAELQIAVKKKKNDEDAAMELEKMKQDDVRRKNVLRRRQVLQRAKKDEKEAVKRGKQPYFLKEKDIRKLESKARFEELKKVGGVKKYIEKRRRKQASKDRKLLPKAREE